MQYGLFALAAVIAIQTLALAYTLRRLRGLGHVEERLTRLAAAMTLLTDTTEAGLTTLATEVGQFGRRRSTAAASPRSAVARRVSAAAKHGEAVAQIASRESLSESEVRLHLALAERQVAERNPHAPLHT